MSPSQEQVYAGQAIYNRKILSIYDLLVLGISNRFIWKCPTPGLLAHYHRHLSDNHLDVGVGTGYFLDKARLSHTDARICLMDLNPQTLAYAAARIAPQQPELVEHNVLEPLSNPPTGFDSIGINYLLHCLPGSMPEKTVVFEHLKPLLNPGGRIFGSTILSQGVPRSWTADRLMAFYNRKGIFSNQEDGLDALQQALKARFDTVEIEMRGVVAVFSAQQPIS